MLNPLEGTDGVKIPPRGWAVLNPPEGMVGVKSPRGEGRLESPEGVDGVKSPRGEGATRTD